jgi:hypothetical protein
VIFGLDGLIFAAIVESAGAGKAHLLATRSRHQRLSCYLAARPAIQVM